MNDLFILFLLLVFIAGAMLVEGLYLAWNARYGPEAQRTAARLRAISAAGEESAPPALVKKRLLSKVPAVERLLLAVPRIHLLDRFLLQSGMELTVGSFLGIALVAAVVAAGVALLLGVPLTMAVAIGLAVCAAWALYVEYRRVSRLREIDRQLPDVLDLMARAMQAGHAFSSAMRFAGTEGPQPAAKEFEMTFDELNFGMPLDDALTHLATRVPSRDLRFFVEAVMIQRDTGGNLAELLVSIANLVRERQKLVATVRVLATEGRISAWILGILPFAIAGIIAVINPVYISRLRTDPAGVNVVVTVLVLMALGIFWMWRMVRFRI